MTTPGADLEDLADAFFSAAHALKRTVNARFQPSGLSLARLRTLYQLVANGPSRMGELSACLDVAPRTMTSTVDAMVRDGLVERQPDPADGRATVVAITDAGLRAYEEGRRLQARAVADLFDVLDAGQRAALAEILARLEGAVAEAESAGPDVGCPEGGASAGGASTGEPAPAARPGARNSGALAGGAR
ncbi:MAG TPA: MarR family winged helix-turn-helix transcriptional regulator [Acidimicrobiales bacterium]